jgi:hypothetical protein
MNSNCNLDYESNTSVKFCFFEGLTLICACIIGVYCRLACTGHEGGFAIVQCTYNLVLLVFYFTVSFELMPMRVCL